MSDDNYWYTTAEMHRELNNEGADVDYDEVEQMFLELEAEGVIQHAGTTGDGEDMWDVQSTQRALRFLAAESARMKLRSWKDRIVGSNGGDGR